MHFSTEQLPVEDRVAIWREEFGRQILRLDIEPIPDTPFHGDIKIHPLPTLKLAWTTACGMRGQRTRELMSDGNDEIGLVVNPSGPFPVATPGGELILGDSHEYDAMVDPFDKTEIDDLILGYMETFLNAPGLRIAARWHGVYAKHPQEHAVILVPEPGVTVVTGVGGAGMTLSFGLAEQVVRHALGESESGFPEPVEASK